MLSGPYSNFMLSGLKVTLCCRAFTVTLCCQTLTVTLCCQTLTVTTVIVQYQHVKVKANSFITGHEEEEGEYRYSSALSLTSAVDGGGWSTPHLSRFTPGKETLCTGGRVSPSAALLKIFGSFNNKLMSRSK